MRYRAKRESAIGAKRVWTGVDQSAARLSSPVLFAGLPKWNCERRGGLMVSMLDSGSRVPGLSPGRGSLCVFLGKWNQNQEYLC